MLTSGVDPDSVTWFADLFLWDFLCRDDVVAGQPGRVARGSAGVLGGVVAGAASTGLR